MARLLISPILLKWSYVYLAKDRSCLAPSHDNFMPLQLFFAGFLLLSTIYRRLVSSAWIQSSLELSSLQSIRGSIPSAKMAAGLVFVKIVLLCTFATLTRTQSNRTVFSPSSSSGNSHESVLDRCFQKCASLLCVISVPWACQLIDKHMYLSCHARVEFTEAGRFANGHFANVSGQFANV